MQEIILIAAMAENRVIGYKNTIPFSAKGNLARFKEITMGWPCVMGRKTWESLPQKPLKGRLNVVISGTNNDLQGLPDNDLPVCPENITADYADITQLKRRTERYDRNSMVKKCASVQEAVNFCSGYEKIFICGGESIYKQFMPLAGRIDLTLVPGKYEGDAFFPEIGDNWEKTDVISFEEFSVAAYIKTNQEKL